MSELFLGGFRALSIYVLLPTFLVSVLAGWLHSRKTRRSFSEVSKRVILLNVAVGLPIIVVGAAYLAWWIITHMPAPE
jgi:uncharacterized membrane protein